MLDKSYIKRCKKCSSKYIKKDGFRRGKQRYKCKIIKNGNIFIEKPD
ncbi:MAG: hypothetical protein PHF46_03775 [Candidatus Gracilibacteria bacterium]|nr:hypothetical protein [Candidatus Gracilibacteria bacterium]MDD3120500.1 hypothetical protein [Candidatus Gracilibacteria bacterium]